MKEKIIAIINILLGWNETDSKRNYCKYSKSYRSWKTDHYRR